jgi:hypothetical protein
MLTACSVYDAELVKSAHLAAANGGAPAVSGTPAVSGAQGVEVPSMRGCSAGSAQGQCYVSLASAAWPGLDSATFESWVTWRGKGPSGDTPWQRIFDFGDQTGSVAHSYLFLTPESKSGLRAAFSLNGNAPDVEVSIASPSALRQNVVKHIAVVVDGVSSTLSLYLDGAPAGSVALPAKLTSVRASNLWLGRSNFTNDPAFFGSLHEFRIYAAALTADQLKASFATGPDYAFRP